MKSIRDKYTRRTTSALSSHVDHDYVLQNNLQPELSYHKFSTIFSSQLAPETSFNPFQEDQQNARQKLREYINLKKVNTVENVQFQSKEFQPVTTEVHYPKLKKIGSKHYQKPHSLQLDQENNFNSLNLASTQRINKPNDAKQISKLLENERLINLELKQETQNLRAQIYELRNVEIELEKIKIYVRKLQNQLSDQNSVIFDLKSQNENFLKAMNHFQTQIQLKLKKQQLMEIKMIQAEKSLRQLTEQKFQKQKSQLQEKQRKDSYIKQLEMEAFEKQNYLTEIERQNQKVTKQVSAKQKEITEIYAQFERSLEIIELMENEMQQLKNGQNQMQKSWEKEVQKYGALFGQLQKAIEQKSQQTSLTQNELNQVNQELQKTKFQSKKQSESIMNDMAKLKELNEQIKRELQNLKQSHHQKKQESEEPASTKQYVPKKWFQQKIYYEYTLNSLQNELQALKQQNQELLELRPKSQTSQNHEEQLMLAQGKTHQNTETQTEQINLGEIELEQSEKSRIIQQQEQKIYCLQKELDQVYTLIDQQKHYLEQGFIQQLRQQQEKHRQLHKRYHDEKEKLLKEKQHTEDLTMELLLLNQEVQQSRVKIRSKQHL